LLPLLVALARPRVIARLVDWPRSVKPVVVITVGCPCEGETGKLPALRRKPLDEIVRWL